MLLYLDKYTTEVIAFNDVINKEEATQYLVPDEVIWVDGLKIEEPQTKHNEIVKKYFDGTKIDYVIQKIEPVEEVVNEHEKTTREIHENVTTVSDDNMINMDMLLDLDLKITALLEHLGIDY